MQGRGSQPFRCPEHGFVFRGTKSVCSERATLRKETPPKEHKESLPTVARLPAEAVNCSNCSENIRRGELQAWCCPHCGNPLKSEFYSLTLSKPKPRRTIRVTEPTPVPAKDDSRLSLIGFVFFMVMMIPHVVRFFQWAGEDSKPRVESKSAWQENHDSMSRKQDRGEPLNKNEQRRLEELIKYK